MTRASLTPCAACARHVRRTESACPFCGVALALDARPARGITQRLGRAALFSLGAAAITSVGGCGLAHERGSVVADQDSGTFFGAYGAPALDDAAPIAEDAGAPMTHYGAPPPLEDAAALEQDAGVDADLGCCNADYGGPPFP